MTSRRCTFLRCPTKPTHVVYPAYGRPWFGCPGHYPAMEKALSLGQPAERAARARPLMKKAPRLR